MLNKVIHFLSLVIISAMITGCASNIYKTSEVVEVAVFLPFSGKDAEQSQNMLKLIKEGFIHTDKTHYKLSAYDASSEESLNKGMDEVIAKNIKVILGPLYSNSAAAIKNKAKKHGINIITLSNNPALADSNVFLFGHAPGKQTDRLISYLLDNKRKNFFLLLPSGSYSYNLSKILQARVVEQGGMIVRSEFYSEYNDSINAAVKNISDGVDILNEDDTNITKPVIYVGDDQKMIELLFQRFYKYSLDSKADVVGDSRIDIITDQPVKMLYSGSLNVNEALKARFKEVLGREDINYLEALAYDLALVSGAAIGDKYDEANFRAKLTDPSGYIGITGVLRINGSITERQYDIIKREGSNREVVDKSVGHF